MNERVELEDLEAMRQEHGVSGAQKPGGGLPYDVNDDLEQIRRGTSLGMSLEDWSKVRGVSLEYASALRRYVEQQHEH